MTLSTKKSNISISAHQHVFPSPPFLSPQFLLISIVIVLIKVSLSNVIFAKLNLTVVVESINDSLEAVSLDHMPLLVSLPTHNVFPHGQVLQIRIHDSCCKYILKIFSANCYLLADPRNRKLLEVLISSNVFFVKI